MCLRNRMWTRILVAAIVFRLGAADRTSTLATVNVITTTTTLSPSSGTFASISLTTTTLTRPAKWAESPSQQTHSSKPSRRENNLKLHRVGRGGRGNEMIQCLNGCSSSRCRESCLKRELSDEEIVERTQRCHSDCRDEPDELIQMCIQKCTYYLIDPVEHSLEEEDESTSTEAGGLLPDSPHLRTRIRLIGPNGLPVVNDEDQAPEPSNTVRSTAEPTSDTWTPVYQVRIISKAACTERLSWLWYIVAAIYLALYV